MPDVPVDSTHTMACMEVWGGNRAVETDVVMPGLDARLYSRPYQRAGPTDAGGDIHFITSCASGRIARMIIADVSGHGAPVSRAADALRRLMRRHSNHIDQTRLLEALNREFEQIHDSSDEQDRGGSLLFATAVVATYFAPTDELSIACAGHPRPIHVRRTGGVVRGELIEPVSRSIDGGPSDLPLGVVEGTRFNIASVTLEPDDAVVFYTDSLIEVQDAQGRQLGQRGLAEMLAGISAGSLADFTQRLIAEINAWAGPGPGDSTLFDDDVTILVVRRNARKPAPSLRLGALSSWRIVRDAVRALRPGGLPATFPDWSLRSLGGAMFGSLNSARPREKR